MPDITLNQHYLDRVLDLAEAKPLEVVEDIYSTSGMKLVAKGNPLGREMRERLILHKLKKPLESSIAVSDGVDIQVVVAQARQMLEANPALQLLMGPRDGADAALATLASIPLNNALTVLLSVIENAGADMLGHYLVVSRVAIALANQLGLDEEQSRTVASAGLFHDIGELYINPDYLRHRHKLRPSEWRHIVAHPVVGQKLLQEIGGFHPAVSRAVLEHHERYDGNGYPRQIAGRAISCEGQIVAVAEMIGGLFLQRGRTLERAGIALKVIPGEHAPAIVSALTQMVQFGRHAQAGEELPPAANVVEEKHVLANWIDTVMRCIHELSQLLALKSQTATDLLAQVRERLTTVQRAFTSTGLDFLGVAEGLGDGADHNVDFEIRLVLHEIRWRMRELARDLTLRCDALEPHEVEAFEPLIHLLNAADEC